VPPIADHADYDRDDCWCRGGLDTAGMGNNVYFLRDIFLNLIKSIIGPLVFSTLAVGIAAGGDLRKVGRMGVKALVYFEVVTTRARA
jgi:proton glutamate symport protein